MGIGKEDVHRYKKEGQGKTWNMIWERVMFISSENAHSDFRYKMSNFKLFSVLFCIVIACLTSETPAFNKSLLLWEHKWNGEDTLYRVM